MRWLSGFPFALPSIDLASADAPVMHRVTDYGTHLMVDIEIVAPTRLKAMTPPAQRWTAGMKLALRPREISVYRDDLVVHRAVLDTPIAAGVPAYA